MVGVNDISIDLLLKHDLSNKISAFVDPHLARLMLNFVKTLNIFELADLEKEELRLIEQCGSWKEYIEFYPRVHDKEAPKEVFDKLAKLQDDSVVSNVETDEILQKIFADEDDVEKFKTIKDSNEVFNWLVNDRGFNRNMLEQILKNSMFQVKGGNYPDAAEHLDLFLAMCPRAEKNALSALFGKLCCEILSQHWEDAHDDIGKIKTQLYSQPLSEHDEMTAKTWLMHWALFVYFSPPKEGSTESMYKHYMELLISHESYWNAMRNYCPHLYRYVIASAMITPQPKAKKTEWLSNVTKNIKYSFMDEKCGRLDPVVDFCVALFRENNFGRAKEALVLCEHVLQADMFLNPFTRVFLDQARELLYDSICRVQARLSIPDIAQEIGKNVEDTEKWIVEIIRPMEMEAKVDSEKGEISLEPKIVSSYTQLIAKTKTVALETQRITQELRRRTTKN